MSRKITVLILLSVVCCPLSVLSAEEVGLLLIERADGLDRNTLLSRGIPLVAVWDDFFLAYGPREKLVSRVSHLAISARFLDTSLSGVRYYSGVIRGSSGKEIPEQCGEIVWRDDRDFILKSGGLSEDCLSSPRWQIQEIPREILLPERAVPEEYSFFDRGGQVTISVDPLVQQMVNSVSASDIMTHWQSIVTVERTRYSLDAGCQSASEYVYNLFSGYNLSPQYQYHRTGHAPNVVGERRGSVYPDKIYLVVGHLDDLPSSGDAPGANDNASGSAAVTVLADVMSRYSFEYTVRFLVVTGEEQGLYGSWEYAAEASSRGDDIQGVLNADMIGWEGNGSPSQENLDLSYNDNSEWLATVFAQAAVSYGTGCIVDTIYCPSLTASDHASFWSRGWSAVVGITDNEGYCGHSGNYPYYHTSNDTVANCGDPAFFIGSVKAYLATLAHLAKPLCENPAVPQSLQGSATGPNKVHLSWSPVFSATSYEVYRAPLGCQAGLPFYRIGVTADPFYEDQTASGGMASAYRVMAVDQTGLCRSSSSACIQVTPSGDCLEPPVFSGIEGLHDGATLACSVDVSWPDVQQSFCGPDTRFNVYRSMDPTFEPDTQTLVASCLTGNSWTDHDITSGVTYSYIVRAETLARAASGPCGGIEDFNRKTLQVSPGGPDQVLFFDDFEAGSGKWNAETPWTRSQTNSFSGDFSMFGGDSNNTCAALTMNYSVELPPGNDSRLVLSVSYDMESTYDGVQVQLFSALSGDWQTINPEGGYPDFSSATCSYKSGTTAFSGDQTPWHQVSFNLAPWAGQSVKIRFIMASDYYLTYSGFYCDDVKIIAPSPCYAQAVPTLPLTGLMGLLLLFSLVFSLVPGRRSSRRSLT